MTANGAKQTSSCPLSPSFRYFRIAAAKPWANSAPCGTSAVDDLRASPIGLARRPRHCWLPSEPLARKVDASLPVS